MATRKCLTIKEKVEIVNFNKINKCSVRKLAEKFKVGKTQIAAILKNQDEILKYYHENDIGEKARRMFHGVTAGAVIDKVVLEWFWWVRAQNMPVSGPVLQAKALEIAHELGDTTFKASNGWLERFKIRHGIKFKATYEESKPENEQTKEKWALTIQTIIEGYAPKDVFCAGKTELFYRALPDKTLCFEGEQDCEGDKAAEERLTVLLCASMTGEKLKPLVIGNAAKPRCFEGVDMETLGVLWKFDSNAWMTTDIMEEWLEQLDDMMRTQDRKIILFLDDPSHPIQDLANVKLAFFPPNTTSQPLDQGIIQHFKVKYRQLISLRLICNIDKYSSTHEVTNNINELMGVMWIRSAWDALTPPTIGNCFKKAGFPGAGSDSADVEILIDEEMANLNELTQLSNMSMDAREFSQNDASAKTEDNYMDSNETSESVQEVGRTEEEIKEPQDKIEPDTTIQNYSEGLEMLKKLKDFYERKHDTEGYNLIHKLMVHHEKQIENSKIKKETEIN